MTGGGGLLVPVFSALPACVSLVNPLKPFWSLLSLWWRERKPTSWRVLDGNGVLEWAPHIWSSWSAFPEGWQTEAKLKAEPPVTLPAHSPPSLIPLGPRTCCSLHSEGVSQTRPLGRLLLLLQVCACVTVEMKKEEWVFLFPFPENKENR